MSFEYNRFLGRIATLVIVSTTVIINLVIVVGTFLRVLHTSLLLTIISTILSFSGQILFLIAMNRFANYYHTRAIFRNVLYAFIVTIIGSVTFIILTYGIFSSLINSLEAIQNNPSSVPPVSIFIVLITFFGIIWLATSLLALFQGIFYRRAFYALTDKSGEYNFRQAGFWMFLGGILTIIAIGAIMFLVGWIFAIIGFFHMKPPLTASKPLLTQPSH